MQKTSFDQQCPRNESLRFQSSQQVESINSLWMHLCHDLFECISCSSGQFNLWFSHVWFPCDNENSSCNSKAGQLTCLFWHCNDMWIIRCFFLGNDITKTCCEDNHKTCSSSNTCYSFLGNTRHGNSSGSTCCDSNQ